MTSKEAGLSLTILPHHPEPGTLNLINRQKVQSKGGLGWLRGHATYVIADPALG